MPNIGHIVCTFPGFLNKINLVQLVSAQFVKTYMVHSDQLFNPDTIYPVGVECQKLGKL